MNDWKTRTRACEHAHARLCAIARSGLTPHLPRIALLDLPWLQSARARNVRPAATDSAQETLIVVGGNVSRRPSPGVQISQSIPTYIKAFRILPIWAFLSLAPLLSIPPSRLIRTSFCDFSRPPIQSRTSDTENMAETQTAPSTVEINDAIFCTHFKEVVRPVTSIVPHYLDTVLTLAFGSALIVTLTVGRRTPRSLGYVS